MVIANDQLANLGKPWNAAPPAESIISVIIVPVPISIPFILIFSILTTHIPDHNTLAIIADVEQFAEAPTLRAGPVLIQAAEGGVRPLLAPVSPAVEDGSRRYGGLAHSVAAARACALLEVLSVEFPESCKQGHCHHGRI